MADKTVRGRFVWHELMTPDSAASHAFYSRVLGWKTQPWDQDPSYAMFAASSGPVGATVVESAGPARWLHYVATPDIEATVRQATSLGASVTKEVTAGGGGQYAALTDPQGAAFALYSAPSIGREKAAKRGDFSWHELATTDAKAALEFYTALFGWEKGPAHDMGPMGFYYLFTRNSSEIGGMFDKPAEMPGPAAWLGYVRVKDVNKAVKKSKSAGGTLLNGPMEVPGGDWIAQIADPHGAMFAVHVMKADLAPAAPAAAPAPAQAAVPPPAEKPAAVKPAARKAASAKKSTVKKQVKAKAKVKAKVKAKAKTRPKQKAVKRAAAKSVKRSARKAAKVGTRASQQKRKAAGKKKSAGKAPKKVRARARKGK